MHDVFNRINVACYSRFYVFEMPISGYLGYLPFGLECAIVTKIVCKQGPDAKYN